MPSVQELQELFEGTDDSGDDDDSDDADYRDDDDQPQGRGRPHRRVNESDEEKEEENVEPETEHVPDRPDHVEEDGHVPTDGRTTVGRDLRSPAVRGMVVSTRLYELIKKIGDVLAVRDRKVTYGSRAHSAGAEHDCRRRGRGAPERNGAQQPAPSWNPFERSLWQRDPRTHRFLKPHGKRFDCFVFHACSLCLLALKPTLTR